MPKFSLMRWLLSLSLAGIVSSVSLLASFQDYPHGVAVRLEEGVPIRDVARAAGANRWSPIAYLPSTYLLTFAEPDGSADAIPRRASRWEESSAIVWYEKQIPEPLFPHLRPANPLNFSDPSLAQQWYLINNGQTGGTQGIDLNIIPLWQRGLNGSGIVVAVVDEAIQGTHPDLSANFRQSLSYNFNEDNRDVSPRADDEGHGTAVAGIIAARDNNIGGIGAAFRSGIAGIRLIAAPTTDAIRANALSFARDAIAIYNNSWGPSGSDDGIVFRGPGRLVNEALENNARFGRGGLGNLYVFSAGNRRQEGDNTNFNGYTNSRYTIAVGAVGQRGSVANYSNPGASLALVAPSNGDAGSIFTTDLAGSAGNTPGDFRNDFGGTSAAAPMVAATIALMLQANPGLNWREVLDILLRSARRVDPNNPEWTRNGAGLWVSHDHGHGLVDALAAVNLAQNYPGLPPAQFRRITSAAINAGIPDNDPNGITNSINVGDNLRLEHVEVNVTLNHARWGDLEIILTSPSGTRSVLSTPHGEASGSVGSWRFMSLRHWGETSAGTWSLQVIDRVAGTTGSFGNWELRLHGPEAAAVPNRPPAANDLLIRSTDLQINLDPRQNDSDPDGDPLRTLSVGQPQRGYTQLLPDGRILYQRPADLRGDDTFHYTITDSRGGTAEAFVTIRVPLPIARNLQVATAFNRPLTFNPLENDIDPDGGDLSLVSVQSFGPGLAQVTGPSQVRFQPDGPQLGPAGFTYQMRNPGGSTDQATATVIITPTPEASIHLNGRDEFVRVDPNPAINLRNAFTVEAWIYPRGWGEDPLLGYGRIVDKDKFLLFLSTVDNAFYEDNSLVFFLRHENGTEAAFSSEANSIQLNTWQHVAATYDGATTVRLYINGRAQTLTQALEAPAGRLADHAAEPLWIGESARGDRAFEGAIREVRLWNRALPENEINAHRQSFNQPNRAGLVARFPLTENAGRQISDTGPNNLSAVLTGGRREAGRTSMEFLHDAPIPFGTGWHFSPWKGWVYGLPELPWIYHLQHGWQLAAAEDSNTTWVFDRSLGWLYTSRTLYPYLYRAATGSWLFYERDSANPRWFYDFTSNSWFNPGG